MRLFVGNLSFQTTEDNLRDAFGAFGSVTDLKIMTDRETGRSRGFGFVEMNTEEEANRAIEALNESDYNGRPLTVNIAKPREAGGGGGGGGRGGYGGGGGGYGGGGGGGDRY